MKSVGHLDWRTVFEAEDELSASEIDKLDWYFSNFVQPRLHETNGQTRLFQLCVNCGLPQKPLTPILGSGYIPHPDATQDGMCSQCRWPGRDRHTVVGDDGEVLINLIGVPLQYHPSHVIPKSHQHMT